MRHCTTWILAKILCIVLVQLPTNTTSEYIQPKYNEVPKEIYLTDMALLSTNVEKKIDSIPYSSTSYMEPQNFGRMPFRRKNQDKTIRGSELVDQILAPTRMKRIPDPSSYYSPQTLNANSLNKLHDLIIRMKIWESALLNHFENKYGILFDTEYLAMDPTWIKVMRVRSAIKTLSNQWVQLELKKRELDPNRMKMKK